ncbi:Beta-galactosidase [Thalictrum thalictroides]|uniref:beta-galactosidase n=1 Tax=Thalictrum thalictroides TaxID=46969 RepID=A0A7J6UVU0_THATH|nr:Beta-galactosidase [Thalictrum thalictroides]
MAEIWTKTAAIVFFFLLLTAVSLGGHFPSLAPLSESSFDLQNSVIRSPTFDIADDKFWKDGQPFQIIGGDLHYFRVIPEYWEDRLLRAKALGLNTIQTYVPWNLHEPEAGKWVFEVKTCHKLGFLVMLRPGPYICAEWDFGGFPAWMLSIEPALRLRSSDPAFLELIENEFGSYADDKSYHHHLVALARKHLGGDTIL